MKSALEIQLVTPERFNRGSSPIRLDSR